MRTALVHDWLTGMRGGEKVLELLCEVLPGSDLYTLLHVPHSVSSTIESRRVVTSWLNRLPGIGRWYRYLLPMMPLAVEGLRLDGYDLVVAVSHCAAHGVTVRGGRFVCYCLTPMRYIWDTVGSYFSGRRRRDLRYWMLRRLSGVFRRWDREAASRVDEYVTISHVVQERVKSCYGRDSRVIYPPVDTTFHHPVSTPRRGYYLWAGALAPYKRVDLALEAFAKLDAELWVVGEGQDLAWARRRATANVKVLGRVSDDELRRCYSGCRALVFPGEEDFGIVPVEAQACGRPVIAYGRGGVRDTVVPADDASGRSPSGIFFDTPTAEGLVDAVRRFESVEDDFDADAIRGHALTFSRERCRTELTAYLCGAGGAR
ncbi:MAG TPA: glycosyltransferase [Planctomycetota bacterium]|nr:glycosyltransferase [Planctomycetota bacterium]